MTQDSGAPVIITEYPPPSYAGLPESTGDVPASDDVSTSGVAKDQAAGVAQGAAEAGQHVAGVAKDQATQVTAEASRQAKDLLSQTRSEVQDQAASQQKRVASGIRSLSGELGAMADSSEQNGTATDLIRQASQRAEDVAGWLETREPGDLVREATSFARRRPGAFLAIALGAGLLAGRLTRGAVDASRNDSTSADQPAVPVTDTASESGFDASPVFS